MADAEGHTRDSLAHALGALGPGGTATLRFEDYARIFGTEPTEDEIEGARAASHLADKHNCEHKVDHGKRFVIFRKR